jgi:PII-like signaling protein
MQLAGEQVLLRVWLLNSARSGWHNSADALVERARREGLAGATQLRGIAGLDFAGQILGGGHWSVIEHVPVLVEIVDQRDSIGRFLPHVAELAPLAMATLERAHVLVYRQNPAAAASLPPALPASIPPLSSLPSTKNFPIMKTSQDGQLVRVFVGESDQWNGQPLASAILRRAQELGLAGATVLRGVMGYGANCRLHSSRLLELSSDLPVVIEMVDTEDKLDALLPFLDECVQEGLITVEDVRVLKFRAP